MANISGISHTPPDIAEPCDVATRHTKPTRLFLQRAPNRATINSLAENCSGPAAGPWWPLWISLGINRRAATGFFS